MASVLTELVATMFIGVQPVDASAADILLVFILIFLVAFYSLLLLLIELFGLVPLVGIL